MYIELIKNNGTDYLRLVKSERYTNDKGVRTARKKLVYSIGPLSKFDDGLPDYVDRLKQSFKNGVPLIPALQQYCNEPLPRETYKLEFVEGSSECFGETKIYAHCLIERILEELGLPEYIRKHKQNHKIEFNVAGYFRLLVYGRILNPASKFATVQQNNDYYKPLVNDVYPYNVYDTLDFMYRFRESIIRKLNKEMTARFGRNSKLVYYDVTNFFFETEDNDEDFEDEDGNVTIGIRKIGVSKENKKTPIVQMGMFMDEQGMPISIEVFPGNTLDHLTMIDACKNTVDTLGLSRFIFVADKGMCASQNMLHLIEHNKGYVISKSIRKASKDEKEWIKDPEGYISKGDDFKYKSRIVRRTVSLRDSSGVKKSITEKVIVYWSRKFYMREMAENKSFLEFLSELEKNPANFRCSASQAKAIKPFLKKEFVNKDTGEILKSSKLIAMIDYDKVNAYKDLFGYYEIATSELEMDDLEVIDTYHGLSRIEDQFRVMKGTLETRPVYVRTPEHIKAHLLLCMISLLVIRLIQAKIHEYQIDKKLLNKDDINLWKAGLSADRIQRALNKWTVDKMPDDYYRFNNLSDPDLKLILDAYGIKIPAKLFKIQELKSIKTSIQI